VSDRAGALLVLLICWAVLVALVVIGIFTYAGFSLDTVTMLAKKPDFWLFFTSPFILLGLWLWSRRSLGV